MEFKRKVSSFKSTESATTIAREINSNLTAGHREDLPEIYILVLVSLLFVFFIRVGGNFISVSGVFPDFLFVNWEKVLSERAYIELSVDRSTAFIPPLQFPLRFCFFERIIIIVCCLTTRFVVEWCGWN